MLAGQGSFASGLRFALARYNAAGVLDPSFGAGGVVTTPLAEYDRAYALALQPDGKIVAAGSTYGTETHFGLARYQPNGSLDPGFGSSGILKTPLAISSIGGLALQPDGKMVAVGQSSDGSRIRFALARYLGSTLTVTRSGSGMGTVTSTPTGIRCGTTCSAPFAADAVVSLSAGAAAGSSFAGWAGECAGTGSCIVRLGADRHVVARFESDKRLTVTKVGSGSGRILSSPPGIDCRATCSHTFVHGSTASLFARPARGTRFAGWGGDCTGRSGRARFEPLCLVPRLKGKTLTKARMALRSARCALGKVRRVYSARLKKGRVVTQRPAAGTVHPRGSKVNVTVSKGRKR